MRCPKCHYLSFDPEPRCRNCGYSFSLSESDLTFHHEHTPDSVPRELTVELEPQDPEPVEIAPPVQRANVREEQTAAPVSEPDPLPSIPPIIAPPPAPVVEHPADLPVVAAATEAVTASDVPLRRVPARAVVPAPTAELPLFVKGLPEEETASGELPSDADEIEPALRLPLPSAPRPPLSVRRQQSAPRKPGPLDRDLLEDLDRMDKRDRISAERAAPVDQPVVDAGDRAGVGKRLTAAGLDAVLLGALAAAVIWVTLRWCDLPLDHARDLPWLPTLAFLLLVVVGYVLMFTAASGQTVGKMLTGLRVVDDGSDGTAEPVLTTRRAVYRALVMVPSVLALGAGFLPALVGDERALHDRIAHTRVVRA
jgi:uncharacterized RDD family membrane protein YckC